MRSSKWYCLNGIICKKWSSPVQSLARASDEPSVHLLGLIFSLHRLPDFIATIACIFVWVAMHLLLLHDRNIRLPSVTAPEQCHAGRSASDSESVSHRHRDGSARILRLSLSHWHVTRIIPYLKFELLTRPTTSLTHTLTT